MKTEIQEAIEQLKKINEIGDNIIKLLSESNEEIGTPSSEEQKRRYIKKVTYYDDDTEAIYTAEYDFITKEQFEKETAHIEWETLKGK